MKIYILLALCLLMALPADAATANFQGNCLPPVPGVPTDCVFDATRTPMGGIPTACPGSAIRRYFWDFGDGTSTFATPPPPWITHTYTSPITTWVYLTVFCNDGTSATNRHCFSNQIAIAGCVIPGAGWTP